MELSILDQEGESGSESDDFQETLLNSWPFTTFPCLVLLGIMAQSYSTAERGCWGVRQPCILHASVC